MIKRKTLVVLGAGASAEVDLPTGAGLVAEIAPLLDIRFDSNRQKNGDVTIMEAIRLWTRGIKKETNVNPTLHAAWRIRDAMPQAMSIDNYIDAHSGNDRIEICGKLAIVRSILNAERGSRLYVNRRRDQRTIDFRKSQETWFNRLFQIITESCDVEGLSDRLSTLVFVVFNYDRCLEHFLYHSLQNYYGIDASAAAQFVSQIEIYHPYGQVGTLPWQSSIDSIEFGDEPSPNQLLSISSQIRTFTEGTDPESSDIDSIRKSINDSSILIFLGFAFHRLNMELLTGPSDDPVPKRCFATARRISDYDCSLIERDIADMSNSSVEEIHIRNSLTCNDLFVEYWRVLSIS